MNPKQGIHFQRMNFNFCKSECLPIVHASIAKTKNNDLQTVQGMLKGEEAK